MVSEDLGLLEKENGNLFGMRYGEWTKKETVHNPKEGRVDGHAESQCDDGDNGETGVLGEGARGVTEVSSETAH